MSNIFEDHLQNHASNQNKEKRSLVGKACALFIFVTETVSTSHENIATEHIVKTISIGTDQLKLWMSL